MDVSKHWKEDEVKKEVGLSPSELLGILAVTKCPLQSKSDPSLGTVFQCPPGATCTHPTPFVRHKKNPHAKSFS